VNVLVVRVVAAIGLALAAFWFGDTRTWEAFLTAVTFLLAYLGAESKELGRQRYYDADRALFAEFQRALPFVGPIEFLRDHDFHVAFDLAKLDPLREFTRRWSDAGHRFHDNVLQEKLEALNARIVEALGDIALNTFPSRPGPMQELSPHWSFEKQAETGDQLNRKTDLVVTAFESFVENARKRLHV